MSALTAVREVPERALRSMLLGLSRRPSVGRLARRLGLTRSMVDRFVAGQTLDEALSALARLRAAGLATTVDVLGESVDSTAGADAAADGYVEALEALASHGLDRNVSLKLSQMGLAIDRDLCRANLERILRRAEALGAFVRIDMEDSSTTDATLELWRELRPVHRETGVVIQAALRRSPDDVTAIIAAGGRIRLCKGAYREPPAVALQSKAEVDRAYAALMERLLHEADHPAIATHDERLIRRAIEIAAGSGVEPERFEFQMLYGVRRDLQERLVADGWRVRVYVPYGADWYPYFMRRLAERPANVAFVLRSVLLEGRGSRSPGGGRRAGSG